MPKDMPIFQDHHVLEQQTFKRIELLVPLQEVENATLRYDLTRARRGPSSETLILWHQ